MFISDSLIFSLLLSDVTGQISFLLLSNYKFRRLVDFQSNIGFRFNDWQYSKKIGILLMLTYLIKLIVDLTTFLYLEHIYNLDLVITIVNSRNL